MARIWYPETPTGRMWAELTVDDPGYGRLVFRRLDDHHVRDSSRNVAAGTLAGPRLAELLHATTGLALGLDRRPQVRVLASTGEPIVIEQPDAAGLLPRCRRRLCWPWPVRTATTGVARRPPSRPRAAVCALQPGRLLPRNSYDLSLVQ